jgi:hypothetical protein
LPIAGEAVVISMANFSPSPSSQISVTIMLPGPPTLPVMVNRRASDAGTDAPISGRHPEDWTWYEVDGDEAPRAIVMGCDVPAAIIRAVPEALVKENVYSDAGGIVCVRAWNCHQGRWCRKYDGRKGYGDGDVDTCRSQCG